MRRAKKPKNTAFVIMKRDSTVPQAWCNTKLSASDYTGIPYSTIRKSFEASNQHLGREWAIYGVKKHKLK